MIRIEPTTRSAAASTTGAAGTAGGRSERAGVLEAIARTILFLASGRASFIAGRILAIDGGGSAG
jgi:NAD(P)-dependent dehydrogenase (short-subunit alcohol dehydrogenase family)